MDEAFAARKRADLLSVAGAALAGVAFGAWLPAQVRPLAGVALATGLLAHAAGMATRHRLDRDAGAFTRGWQALYVACWISIAALLSIGVARWFAGAGP